MLKKLFLAFAALSLVFSVSACNTMRGAGQDVEKAGQKVQKEANEHQKY